LCSVAPIGMHILSALYYLKLAAVGLVASITITALMGAILWFLS
jgi:hypothetical protein